MFKNLDSVPASVRSTVESYFTQIVNTLSDKADSIYLYGSAVTPDFIPDQSDVNSLVLLKSFGSAELNALRPIVRGGLKNRIVAPLCLSVETFHRSADTFPLEFIEMKDKHLCLFGECDLIEALEIPREYLRVKIEEQIKGKLIRLRQFLMEFQGADKQLADVLVDAQKQLFPVFRNLLRFMGLDAPPVAKDEILREVETRAQFTMLPCRQVREHAAGRGAIKANALTVYCDYIDVLLKLAQIVDRWESN